MKTLTVRVPDAVVAEIETAARARNVTKSDVIRERLSAPSTTADQRPPALQAIAHLIGSVRGLPADLSANKKKYLKAGYGRKRPR
jgi:Arc/MetJ-type ribon-helix-helix transcriptional regulator